MRRRARRPIEAPARRRRIEAETAPPPPRTAVSGHAPSSAGRASGARDRRGGHPRHRHAAATPPPRCASGSVEDVGGVEEDFFDAFALLAAEADDAVAAAVAGARPFTRPLEVAAAP